MEGNKPRSLSNQMDAIESKGVLQMTNRMIVAAISMCFAILPQARAGDAMKEAFSTIPGDATIVLCVPSLKQLDADYQDAVKALGLQAMVPPPMNSLIGALKQSAPMLAGIDEEGVVAVVVMPFTNMFELQQKQALIIPTKDPKAMIEAMGGEQGDDGSWKVTLFGTPSFAAVAKNRLIVTQSPGTAKAVAESKVNLASKFKAHDLDALTGLDVALWINFEPIAQIGKQMMPMFTQMMAAGATTGFEATQAELTKKQIEMFMDGVSSVAIGVSLDKVGLGLRGVLGVKPGSELAKQTGSVTNVSESLLRGLPADRYMVAFGQHLSPEQAKVGMESIEPYFEMAEKMTGMDESGLKSLRVLLNEWAPMARSFKGSVNSLAPGPGGVVGMAFVIETTDGVKWVETAAKVFDEAKGLLTKSDLKEMGDEIKPYIEHLVRSGQAETVAGIKVDQYSYDPVKADLVDEEDWDDVKKVIGQDGLVLRVASASKTAVVVAFGGGKDYLAKLIDSVKKNETLLDEDAGIKKVAAHQPKDRGQVMYFAVDRILATINNAMKALDEEQLPVSLPELNAPIAITVSGGKDWSRGDVLLPMELLVAGKDAAMVMMGGAGGAQSASATPAK